jgi:hypothetical protein
MDINILVGPVYERQRAQSTDVSDPDVNHTLCVPMGMHIGMVSLYAGMPEPRHALYPQADYRQLKRLLIEAHVTFVRSMILIELLPFVRQHTFR